MKTKCFIFGAGKQGEKLLAYLKAFDDVDVIAFIDNNISKQNTIISGIRCISIDEAIRMGGTDEVVFVSPKKSIEIKKQLEENVFTKIFCVGSWICRQIRELNYYFPKILEESDYARVRPFNHYESPYPDIVQIHKREKEIFSRDKEVLDIDFNISQQLKLVKKMEQLDLPGWTDTANENGYRYYYNNNWFGKGSADALCYMMRIVKPRKIIEIGSGYSTSVMLDTNEIYFDNKISITSIEPRADRLKALLKETDNIKICECDMQEVPVSYFEQLEENDILFIDSSHVSRIDSDVNRVFFEILPRLKQGVYIHFHDIIYPFIYPKAWIYEGRAYTEAYLLRAFLMNNCVYSIQFFGNMLRHKYNNEIPDNLKECGSGSIWIKKERSES